MRKTWATLISLLLCLSLGELASAQSTSEALPEESAPPGGTVEVAIDGIEGASGSRLAAILYEGVPPLAGGDTPLHGLGSFVADITSDSFSVKDTIREGSGWWDSTADDPVADVPPGIHTLIIWVSSDLGPYSEWVPAEPVDWACARFLTVPSDSQISIELGPPPADVDWQAIDALPNISVCEWWPEPPAE